MSLLKFNRAQCLAVMALGVLTSSALAEPTAAPPSAERCSVEVNGLRFYVLSEAQHSYAYSIGKRDVQGSLRQTREFAIDKGELAKQVDEFSARAQVSVFYLMDDLHGIQGGGTSGGTLTAYTALQQLLAGTGCSAELVHNDMLLVYCRTRSQLTPITKTTPGLSSVPRCSAQIAVSAAANSGTASPPNTAPLLSKKYLFCPPDCSNRSCPTYELCRPRHSSTAN